MLGGSCVKLRLSDMGKIYKYQSGVVLVVGLIMLLLLTVIGMSATQTSVLEEKMSGNMYSQNLAFQAAESTLLAAEAYLSTTVTPVFNCTKGLYLERDSNCDSTKEALEVWEGVNVWSDDTKSVKYDIDGKANTIDLVGLIASPRYIIEQLPCVGSTPCSATYRITARAVGNSVDAVVMLQSVYSLP
jgi:type IV pilus assembly protein PilX